MQAKKTLYQVLQAPRSAAADIIKACYEARLRELGSAATPEANSQRLILREAFETLSDPARRQQYEEKLREEARRALSSGGEEVRARPANKQNASESTAPVTWMVAAAMSALVAIGGLYAYNEHKRKLEAQRAEAARQAEQARLREEEQKRRDAADQYKRDQVDWAKQRFENAEQEAAWRRAEYDRERQRQQMRAEDERARREQQYAEQRRQQQERQAEYERQRHEQENLRRSQMQLERERRQLQEMERYRPRNF
jgi:hypothetical protein